MLRGRDGGVRVGGRVYGGVDVGGERGELGEKDRGVQLVT